MGPESKRSIYQTAVLVAFLCILRPMAAIDLKENDACYVGDIAGVCKLFIDCDVLKAAAANGTDVTKEAVRCGFTIHDEIICCPSEFKPSISPDTESRNSPSNETDRPAVQVCKHIEKLNIGPHLTGQIYNGEQADEGEFPHAALILFTEDSVICGGSLIDPYFVLTAAHCVISQRRKAIGVRLGIVDAKDTSAGLTLPIKDVHIHSSYRGSSKYNDIALIELAEPAFYWSNVTWETIGPSCLYTDSDGIDDNSSLTVIGWGEINPRNRSRAMNLMKVNLKLFDEKKCDAEYRSGNYDYLNRGIIDSQLCAYEKDKDACRGDSGGPLNLVVDKDAKKYKVVGIVSTGPLCGVAKPGLYTRVSAFLNFIEDKVWPNGFTP